MFVFTYMYALNVGKLVKGLFTAAYIIFVVFIYIPAPYGFGRDPSFLLRREFLWIPIILYGLAALIALVVFLYLKARKNSVEMAKS